MTIKEYLYIVFHPKKAFSRLRSYIAILESRLDIVPTEKDFISKAKISSGLVVLGNDAVVTTSFFSDTVIVIHPDAKNVMVTNCHFTGTENLVKTHVGVLHN